jgi:Tripartite tricarboxylate transporter family receptor
MIHRRNVLIGAFASIPMSSMARRALAHLAGNAFIISGFPAGGTGDLVSRPLAEKMRGTYASNVLVESKVGAGGRIAAEFVKRANPDGLTILQIPASIIPAHLQNAGLRPSHGFRAGHHYGHLRLLIHGKLEPTCRDPHRRRLRRLGARQPGQVLVWNPCGRLVATFCRHDLAARDRDMAWLVPTRQDSIGHCTKAERDRARRLASP